MKTTPFWKNECLFLYLVFNKAFRSSVLVMTRGHFDDISSTLACENVVGKLNKLQSDKLEITDNVKK